MVRLKSGSLLSRKERRKDSKKLAKEKRQLSHGWRMTKGEGTVKNSPIASAKPGREDVKNTSRTVTGGQPKPSARVGKVSDSNVRTTKEAKRLKRWRPEEIDPMIVAEDEEMKRLERLLGVHGPNATKKRKKLQRELEVDDGLGDDFGSFLTDLDRIGEMTAGGSESDEDENESYGGSAKEAQAGTVDLEQSFDGMMGGLPTISEGQEDEELEGDTDGMDREEGFEEGEEEEEEEAIEESEQEEEGENEEEEEGEEEEEEILRHVYRPQEGQDIYGRAVGGGEEKGAPAKYIPPHLRGAGGTNSTGERRTLVVQRTVNGILNRLSEDTLDPVTTALRDLYRLHSNSDVSDALWQSTRAVCIHEKQVMISLIPSFAAVIAALHITLGTDIGGHFLEVIAKELNAEMASSRPSLREGRTENEADGRGGGGTGTRRRGTGSNLVLLLGYLYNFGVAHCTLVYDVIRLLVEVFGELEMELLLLLLRHSGFQLRADDPQALKDIVLLVKSKASAASGSHTFSSLPKSEMETNAASTTDHDCQTALEKFRHETWVIRGEGGRAGVVRVEAGTPGMASSNATCGTERDNSQGGEGMEGPIEASGGGGARARYVVETIVELQSNKRNRLQLQEREADQRFRKWLGGVKAKRGGVAGGDASLRVSWAELTSSERTGRWWRVGAAWAGKEEGGGGGGALSTGQVEEVGCVGRGGLEGGGGGGAVGRGEDDFERDQKRSELLELAKRQRMNTDVRRSVFVAVMGSSDCEDAFEKLLRLNLRGPQEREVARVIMECCGQEATYNAFYAHLAEHMCQRQPKLRFTFQVAFWDSLKTLGDNAARRAANLARLLAHLVVNKQMSLTVLKAVEIPELSPSGLLLLRVFFHDIIAHGDDASFLELFRKLSSPPKVKDDRGGHSQARDNALIFLRGRLGSAPRTWDKDRRKMFRKRVKGACRLMDRIAMAEDLR